METTVIFEKICAVINECLGLDASEVKPESHFMNDLGSDSIMLSEIIMKLEDEFHIRISDEDASTIRTVGDAMEYIRTHLPAENKAAS